MANPISTFDQCNFPLKYQSKYWRSKTESQEPPNVRINDSKCNQNCSFVSFEIQPPFFAITLSILMLLLLQFIAYSPRNFFSLFVPFRSYYYCFWERMNKYDVFRIPYEKWRSKRNTYGLKNHQQWMLYRKVLFYWLNS